jgi:hypothetical protein
MDDGFWLRALVGLIVGCYIAFALSQIFPA